MYTLSIIKADTGGFVGHSAVHPEMLEEARRLVEAERGQLLIDGQVAACGDDISLIMTHQREPDDRLVHSFASDDNRVAPDQREALLKEYFALVGVDERTIRD